AHPLASSAEAIGADVIAIAIEIRRARSMQLGKLVGIVMWCVFDPAMIFSPSDASLHRGMV
ncbi:MAG: hypothetical protein Q8J76_10335, partial [Desulfobulbaceae bacterium]|nr:hypothetical protein [Desulfobulbaceae bacterium]